MYSPNRFRKRVLVLESLESRVVLSTTTVAPITVLVDRPFDPSAPSLPRHVSAKVDRPFDPSAPSLGFQVKFGRPTVYAPPTPLWARMRSSV